MTRPKRIGPGWLLRLGLSRRLATVLNAEWERSRSAATRRRLAKRIAAAVQP